MAGLVKFKGDRFAEVWIDPDDVARVYEADQYKHRGPNIGIKLKSDTRPVLVYGDDVEEVVEKLNPTCNVEEERDDARAVARAILKMAQDETGRQFVSDHVLETHPWLKTQS